MNNLSKSEQHVIEKLRAAVRRAGRRPAVVTIVVSSGVTSVYEGQPAGTKSDNLTLNSK